VGGPLRHLRFQAKSNGNDIDFGVFGFGIEDRLAVVTVPPLPLENDPSQLLGLAHTSTRFCEGTKQRAASILSGSTANDLLSRESFSFIDERFDGAGAESKCSVAHAYDR